jgi:hypothetical protein
MEDIAESVSVAAVGISCFVLRRLRNGDRFGGYDAILRALGCASDG